MTLCLDSWAGLEWLAGGEPARTRIAGLFAAERPVMSWINLGELAYVLRRRAGPRAAAGAGGGQGGGPCLPGGGGGVRLPPRAALGHERARRARRRARSRAGPLGAG